MHLGDLHAYEQLLVGLIAFGPFVVLIVVVAVLRRRNAAEDERTADAEVDHRAGADAEQPVEDRA